MRVRRPSRRDGRVTNRRGHRDGSGRIGPSGLQLVPKTSNGDDVTGVGGVGFDLRAQAPDVDIDESAVAEIAVPPHPFEKDLTAEDPSGAAGQLDEQLELGLRQVDLFAALGDQALFGGDLEIAELEAAARWVGASGTGVTRRGCVPTAPSGRRVW